MVYFAEPPEVIFINQIQNKRFDVRKRLTWNPLICYIPTIVFVQLDKPIPMTRKEWRKECGKWGKYSDITSTIGKN
jgi:hypothetical protein